MNIKLNELYICNYDPKNISIRNFTASLGRDELIRQNIGRYVSENIRLSRYDSKILTEHGYLIASQYDLIGFIYLLLNFNELGLDFGVHKKFRNQGYETKILKEVSDYFLSERNFVEQIGLTIDSNNVYSEKAAINASFIKVNENYGMKSYVRTLKK